MKKVFRLLAYTAITAIVIAAGFWFYFFIQVKEELDNEIAFSNNYVSMIKSLATIFVLYILYRIFDYYGTDRKREINITIGDITYYVQETK